MGWAWGFEVVCVWIDHMKGVGGKGARTLIERTYASPSLPNTHTQIMVHLYNSGFEPICDATLSLSETAEVEQAWTVEQVRLESWFCLGVDGYMCVCVCHVCHPILYHQNTDDP